MANDFYASYGGGGGSTGTPNTVVTYSKTFADFSTAAMTNTLALPVVPAGYLVMFAVLNITQIFSGGGATVANITSSINSGAIPTGSGDGTVVSTSTIVVDFADHVDRTNAITLDSDVNLDTLTAGAVDLYYVMVKVF